MYVDRECFLKIPHIERDGHVCLGIESIPNDYDDPVGAVARAVRTLKDEVLAPSSDPCWVQEQFHAERASYWNHYCDSRKDASDRRPTPDSTFVDARPFTSWVEGSLTAYIPEGVTHRRFSFQIATTTVGDAHEVATRHKWAKGTMVRGKALFIRVPSNELWTPQTWPHSFNSLLEVVDRLTGRERMLAEWLEKSGWRTAPPVSLIEKRKVKKGRYTNPEQAPPGQRPILVVLAQEGVMFGYQIILPLFPLQKDPGIEPIKITRIDPDWCLARDHELERVHDRQSKRVLILGCGSLGSPLAALLARAGVGQLDLVDSQLMGSENTSRHELGVQETGRSKAQALASQLMKEVPGLIARGHCAEAASWIKKNCQPGGYDLIVDCTAESSVRTFISHFRIEFFGDRPVVHAWTEPLCSAAHVVLTQQAVPWPETDPADSLVNASDLSAIDTRVRPPACSAGFHPYGAADITLVAAFAAERVMTVIDDPNHVSTVWSWVRSTAFFKALPGRITTRDIVPNLSSPFDSATTTRTLAHVLGER